MIDFNKPTALYGGSFDPVHEGHLHVAKEVQRLLPAIEQIVFVPAAQSPRKPDPQAAAELRFQWLEAATAGTDWDVWDYEWKKAGPSFTVESLEEAHRQGAQRERLYWILGTDAYATFPNWKNPERIRALCRLVVVNRSTHPLERQHPDDILLPILPHPASSTALRMALADFPAPTPSLPIAVRTEMEKLFLLSRNPYARKKE